MTALQYPKVHADTITLLEKLGYNVHTVDDQTCCTGFSYHGGLYDMLPLLVTNARNMALFAKYTNNIVTVCNACFSTLNLYNTTMKTNSNLASQVTQRLQRVKLIPPSPDAIKIWHLLEVLYAQQKVFPLTPLPEVKAIKAAVHTGCHLLRASSTVPITSPAAPRFFEDLTARMGATVVPYKEVDLCCGGGWSTRHTDRELSLKVSLQKLKSIHASNATHIIVCCPFCLNVLENAQVELEATGDLDCSLPVWHISQLALLALQ